MSRYNWWRRGHKNQVQLQPTQIKKGRSKLLQKIEHGDFEVSTYLKLAQRELLLAEQNKQTIAFNWKGHTDSLQSKLEAVDLLGQKRYNRLYKDYHKQEQRLLDQLRRSLYVEFKKDLWDQCLQLCDDHDVTQFYHLYKQQAAKF